MLLTYCDTTQYHGNYCKVVSINMSCLEAHFTAYRQLFMKGKFNAHLPLPLKKS